MLNQLILYSASPSEPTSTLSESTSEFSSSCSSCSSSCKSECCHSEAPAVNKEATIKQICVISAGHALCLCHLSVTPSAPAQHFAAKQSNVLGSTSAPLAHTSSTLTSSMADNIITSLDNHFKIALDARLHPLASADLAGQVHEHRVRIDHLRDNITTPQLFSGEVFNAYCDLLRETFCAPGEDVEDDLPVALLPLEFAVALRDQAISHTTDIALDPRNFAQGIDGNNFFRYRAIFIPIQSEDHYTLAIVGPHSQIIKHFDSLQPAAQFTLADAGGTMLGQPPIISGKGANARFDCIKAWVRDHVGHEGYKSFTAVPVEMAPQQASLSGDRAVLVLLGMRLLLAEVDLEDLQYLEDEEMGQLVVEFRYRIMAELVCQKLNPTMQDLPPVKFEAS